MSDHLRTSLLTLLRAGLWEQPIDRLSAFPLSDEAWQALFRMTRQQTVTGIVFRGLHYLPDELLPPEHLLIRWTAEADAIERKNRQMNQTLLQLYSLFTSRGLRPILQKGQGVARLYEQPLLRECGDIDFYFNDRSSWQAALRCIEQQGIRVRHMADRSISYYWQGIEVEHHLRLFDLYNPFLQTRAGDLERRLGYHSVALSPASEVLVTVPSPFINLLLLNLHILKHALGWGIGLRQLCDMARACHRLHTEIDPDEMKKICRKLGIGQWCSLLHAFLVEVLGLPAECLPYPAQAPTSQPLADIVWQGGNFGQHRSGHVRSDGSVWRRKWQTAHSFRRNIRFAFRYAPKEAFWIFADLMKGQIK